VAADGDGACFFTSILDSLTAPCLVYNGNTVMYTVADAASMASARFIHWPVQSVHGLYGPLCSSVLGSVYYM